MVIAFVFYINHHLTIYHQPKITLISPHTFSELFIDQPLLQCFKPKKYVATIKQNHIGLVVWNMHKGGDRDWEQTLKQYAKQKDFILLQEATPDIEKQLDLTEQFPSRLYASAFAYQGKDSGVAMLSQYVPQRYCIGTGKEPWLRIPKMGMAMFFPLQNGDSLLVINLHLVNFEFNIADYQHQIKQMLELVDRHTGPIILAGDFNAWRKLRYQFLKKLTQQYHFQEVNFTPDKRLRFIGNPLDFVFVRGLNVISATTEQTQSSDHNPLFVELELKNTE